MLNKKTKYILYFILLSFAFNSLAFSEPIKMDVIYARKIMIKWEEVSGAVSYKVLIKDKNDKAIIQKDADTNNIVLDILPGDYKISIGSVNKFDKVSSWSDWGDLPIKEWKPEQNTESTEVRSSPERHLEFSMEDSFILPFGKFKDINDVGVGMLLRADRTGLFFNKFSAGIATGYWQFKGATDIDNSYIIPFFITSSYKFNISRFDISPRIAAGMSYNSYTYDNSMTKVKTTKSGIEPLALAGATFGYNINNKFGVFIGTDIGTVIETKNIFPFAVFSAGLSVRF